MTFWKTVGAYLTGWLIAQSVYNRVRKWALHRELQNPSDDMQAHWHEQACAIVDVMEKRGYLVKPHARTADESGPWRGEERI